MDTRTDGQQSLQGQEGGGWGGGGGGGGCGVGMYNNQQQTVLTGCFYCGHTIIQ